MMDRWGMNTVLWGTTGIVVDGVPLSDAACFLQYRLVSLAPGARVPNEIAPINVMTGGEPSLPLSSVGVSLLPETVRILLRSLGNHLDLQTILAAPSLPKNFDFTERGMLQIPQGGYAPDILTDLGARGCAIHMKAQQEVGGIKGTVAIGAIDAADGTLRSAEITGIFSFAEAN